MPNNDGDVVPGRPVLVDERGRPIKKDDVEVALATAAAGFILPDFLLRDEAERRRRAFRHALSSYLDLVNVLLAGGAGIETALHAAADAGDGWGYRTIRSELRRARLTGQSPWDTFAGLADRLGVTELAEPWRPWRAYAVMQLWHHLETS